MAAARVLNSVSNWLRVVRHRIVMDRLIENLENNSSNFFHTGRGCPEQGLHVRGTFDNDSRWLQNKVPSDQQSECHWARREAACRVWSY